jgi:hypothetical protein
MIRKSVIIAASAVALLMLASCETAGMYGPYDSLRSVRGTVEAIDPDHNILILSSPDRSYDTLRVYFDRNTEVNYQGRMYRPENLERGDEVEVNVRQAGRDLYADSMTVTYNSNANDETPSMSSGSSANYSTIRGTVRNVNTYNRTIELAELDELDNRGSVITVQFDPSTRVDVEGQKLQISGLERGDVIEIQAQDLGNGSWLASSITLMRDVRR